MSKRLAVVLLLFGMAGSGIAQQQSSSPVHELHWAALTSTAPLHVAGYELTETFDPTTSERHDFIQAKGGTPRQFYEHNRSIVVSVVKPCGVLLVEDDYTTKLSKLLAIRVDILQRVNLSDAAVATYRREFTAGNGVFVNGNGFAVSPDCNRVLLAVQLTASGAATPEEAQQAAKLYPTRWYSIDLRTGKVVSEYAGSERPNRW